MVKKIAGKSCEPVIQVSMELNGTKEIFKIENQKQITRIYGSIFFDIVGTYDKSETFPPKSFIYNSVNNLEAYVENAATFHVPQRGMIGDVQANSPYARIFLFDEQSEQCHFYQLRMTCP